MPRDLSDVLHYFLPELDGDFEGPPDPARPFLRRGDATTPSPARRRGLPPRRDSGRFPLSILGIPIGERDVVNAAYTWNLALETARLGGSSAIVAPEIDRDSPLWPGSGPGHLDVGIVYSAATDLVGLRRAAAEVAEQRGRTARRGGIVFTRIPPAWLAEPALTEKTERTAHAAAPTVEEIAGDDWIRWLLVFSSARRRDVEATFESVRRWVRERPGLEIGVTIHGVRQIAEAREAFDELARSCDERLGLPLASYGLLVDDLEVYRSIAAGRPIGESQPTFPAARALTDVARLLYEDARSRVLG